MRRFTRAIVALVLASWLALPSSAEEPAKENLTVDFRWIEPQVIKGLTEETGHPIVCGGKDWYAHLKPVLTSKDIATARLTSLNLGQGDQYAVAFTLSDGATAKLVEACGNEPGRMLTVYVNGRWYGSSYFDKTKPEKLSPPSAGYMVSKSQAEQILAANKPVPHDQK